MSNLVASAIDHIGLTPIANLFEIWPSAVQKWRDNGRLPESELSGRTEYAAGIEQLSKGKFSAEQMLEETREAWKKTPLRRGRPKRVGRR